MSDRASAEVLRKLFREQIACLGKVFARHRVPSEAAWEAVKGLDLVYQRAHRELVARGDLENQGAARPRDAVHPAIRFLLSRLEREEASRSGAAPR